MISSKAMKKEPISLEIMIITTKEKTYILTNFGKSLNVKREGVKKSSIEKTVKLQ
jgi:hypothetical protein